METAIDKIDLDEIDRLIAISLGWKEAYFMEEVNVESFKFIYNGSTNWFNSVDSTPSLEPQKIAYYAPPEGEEYVGDSTWRWLENGGIPKFTRNAEDLELLLQAIDRACLSLQIYRTVAGVHCVLRSNELIINTDISHSTLNLSVCKAWMKFFDIQSQ